MKAQLLIDHPFGRNFSLIIWDPAGVLIVVHLFSTGGRLRRGQIEMAVINDMHLHNERPRRGLTFVEQSTRA